MTEPMRSKLSVAALLGFLICGFLLLVSGFAAANHAAHAAAAQETSTARQ